MSKKRSDKVTRRILSKVWHRILWGEDDWRDSGNVATIAAVYVALIVFALTMLSGTTRGDLIIMSDYVGETVTATNPVAVQLPMGIGFLSFSQAETYDADPTSGAAYWGVSPYYDNGVQSSSMAIQVYDRYTLGFPQAVWDWQSREIGYSDDIAADAILWGGGAELPSWVVGDGDPNNTESHILLPWQWELWGPTLRRGLGWVSLSHVFQGQPTAGPNGSDWATGSRYIVERWAVVEYPVQLQLGQVPGYAAVPEPGAIVVAGVVCVGVIVRRVLRWWR
jgi:hypothetical protein